MKTLVATMVLAVGLMADRAFAVTLEVGPGRTYRTIQAAADVAKPGDVVLIDPGIYRERLTPIWKPHSVSLWEMCNDCSTGGHRYFNNVMAVQPQMNKDTKYQTLCEGNGFVPPENWTIYADGCYEIRWPEGVERPLFHPVDTVRLGKCAIVGLPFENRDGTPYVWDAAHSPATASLK